MLDLPAEVGLPAPEVIVHVNDGHARAFFARCFRRNSLRAIGRA